MTKTRSRFNYMPEYSFNSRSAVSDEALTDEQMGRGTDLVVRNISFRKKTFDEGARTVEAVIASENRVVVFDFREWRMIEEVLLFDGLRLPKKIPLQDNHSFERGLVDVLGSNRNLRIEDDLILALVHFAKTTEGERAFILYRDDDLDSFSIGYGMDRTKAITIEPGETSVFEGKTYTARKDIPLRIVPGKAWTLYENSAVSIPADPTAKTRNKKPKQEDKKMKYEDFVRTLGYDVKTYSESDGKYCRSRFAAVHGNDSGTNPVAAADDESIQDNGRSGVPVPAVVPVADPIVPVADPVPAADPVDPEAGFRSFLAKQKAVRASIRSVAENLSLSDGLLDKALEECETVDQARSLFLEDKRSNVPEIGTNFFVKDQNATVERMEAAIFMRTGQQEYAEKIFSPEVCERSVQFSHRSLVDVARTCLVMAGQELHGSDESMIKRAMTATSLPIILGNVAKKSVLQGYQYSESTWQAWCGQEEVSNFHERTGVRLTDVGGPEKVGNSGTIADGNLKEESEKFWIERYSKKIGISEQNLLDDDTKILTRVPMMMGQKTALLNSKLAYTVLMSNPTMSDGKALFHADHNNLNTSAGINIDKLSAGISAYMKQTDADGELIGIKPKTLIVPSELRQTGLELTLSDHLITGTGATRGRKNVNMGEVKSVAEARLNGSGIAGESATTWYLAADPNNVDTIQLTFLKGRNRAPVIEVFPGGVDYHGIKIRVTHDVGANALDHRGLQKNTA